LTVSELRDLPLERLLPRMQETHPANTQDPARRLYNEATAAGLITWLERNPERASKLTPADVDDLLDRQAAGQATNSLDVDAVIRRLERRRELFDKVQTIADSEYLELLEQLVDLLHDKVAPRPS